MGEFLYVLSLILLALVVIVFAAVIALALMFAWYTFKYTRRNK